MGDIEKDIERCADSPTDSPTESSVNKDEHCDGGEDIEVEPIRTGSRARSSKSLGRTRSNNGYGCDDMGDDDDDEPAGLTETEPPARDPFEVGWENGDQDPLCPRSMKTWRKWTIVLITSCGSFCV